MLVIDYLKEHGLESLVEKYAIKVSNHDDGRIILNYNQIDSPKFDPIVEECRGLCLDENFDLVARAFTRFYNLQEIESYEFDDCLIQDKMDGSLTLLYNYDGAKMNTRGSFADGEINYSGMTWTELMTVAEPEWKAKIYGLDNITLVGELCSPYNQIVEYYKEPVWFVLSAFLNDKEMNIEDTRALCKDLGFKMPKEHKFDSMSHVESHIAGLEKSDSTKEGVVIRNINNHRIKVKSGFYVMLHRLSNDFGNLSPKNLLPIVLSGEQEEIIAYFPHTKDELDRITNFINSSIVEIQEVFDKYKHMDRKNFALSIKKYWYKGILFSVYDGLTVREAIKKSKNKIISLL